MSQEAEMLKQFVKQVSASAPSTTLQSAEENQVIFEFEIDGIRYYILRCQPKSQRRPQLSDQEQTIAKLVAQGLSNKCIAKHLNISRWTVASYLRRIFSKLGVSSRAGMVTQLMQQNTLDGIHS